MGKWAVIPVIGSILSVLVVVASFFADDNAEVAAAISFGIALSVIPYILTRSIVDLTKS